MLMRKPPVVRRTAAALIETAVVVTVFLLLLFGVLEYCRYLFVMEVTNNAAREGARFAVVNTNDTTLTADAIALVNAKMGNVSQQLQSYKVQVYAADVNGNNIGAAANAGFGQYIAVQITGNYVPILPTFLRMGSTIPVNVKILMCSEAN
jgi:Flp pilus assembly protein TadG